MVHPQYSVKFIEKQMLCKTLVEMQMLCKPLAYEVDDHDPSPILLLFMYALGSSP